MIESRSTYENKRPLPKASVVYTKRVVKNIPTPRVRMELINFLSTIRIKTAATLLSLAITGDWAVNGV